MSTHAHGANHADLELTVGDRLRRARERRTGLDQGEFAAEINISRGTVSNYERDKIPEGPRRRLVFNAWAARTGVTVEWLETGVSAPRPEPAREGAGSDDVIAQPVSMDTRRYAHRMAA